MSEYCFFDPDAQALCETASIKKMLEDYAEQNKKQMYVVTNPLSKDDVVYEYDNAFLILGAGRQLCFVNTGSDDDAFEDYVEDFIDDIAYLSEKFEYRKKIGRKKSWYSLVAKKTANELNLDELVIENPQEKRIADLLTSLVIGSINDVSKVDLEAQSLLDNIKSKIVLFDTDQTGFVFKQGAGKKFVIQGLAGSGKTELLLHKLKEIYSSELDARIAFTCYNKILASSMKSRIPEFFNFMKVERQIEWEEKLFCFHSWGSGNNPVSGMYRYICYKYGISFGNLAAGSFGQLCKTALEDIKKQSQTKQHEYIFDYVFIDESQDFDDHFMALCEFVTSKRIYIAGDVFQNIFRPFDESVNKADLVLKKCYRTDPKNLMFSHALGMGLYETPVLRWLQVNEWNACGYNYSENNGFATIGRDPLRRFEDIPNQFESTKVYLANENSVSQNICNILQNIKTRHPTVEPGDIAILLIDKEKYIYDVMQDLTSDVFSIFGWDSNIAHEHKIRDQSKLFISNINNAKGLEFPFVICFVQDLKPVPSFRNGLYTMMARSFLESHLILGSPTDEKLLNNLAKGLNTIRETGFMNVRVPTAKEIENQKAMIVWDDEPTLEDRVIEFCESVGATPRLKAKLIHRMQSIMGEVEYNDEYFKQVLEAEHKRFKSL